MENKYQRFINLPFEVEPPEGFIGYDIDPVVQVFRGCYHQKMYEFNQDLGIHVDEYAILYTAPGGKLHIHTDTENIGDDFAKINVTWGGGPDSRTIWWENQGGDENLYVKRDETSNKDETDHKSIFVIDEDLCEPVWYASIDKPSILNLNRLHSTYNPSENSRYTVSFLLRLIEDNYRPITWHEALEIYKDYIEIPGDKNEH